MKESDITWQECLKRDGYNPDEWEVAEVSDEKGRGKIVVLNGKSKRYIGKNLGVYLSYK